VRSVKRNSTLHARYDDVTSIVSDIDGWGACISLGLRIYTWNWRVGESAVFQPCSELEFIGLSVNEDAITEISDHCTPSSLE
jgi:hypothetical protein